MDPLMLALVIGVITLVVERIAKSIKKFSHIRSSCCGNEIEMDEE